MRRIIPVTVLLFWAAASSFALETSFGIRSSAEIGWISGDGWEDRVSSLDDNDRGEARIGYPGWSIAAVLELGIMDLLAVQAEMGYAHLGGAYRYDFAGVEFEGTREHRMFQVPLLVKLRYPVGSGRVFFAGGPGFALFLGPVVYIETVDDTGWIRKENPDLPGMIFVTGVIGYEHPLGPGRIVGELRYTRSTTRILASYSSYINSMGFGLGYLLPYPFSSGDPPR